MRERRAARAAARAGQVLALAGVTVAVIGSAQAEAASPPEPSEPVAKAEAASPAEPSEAASSAEPSEPGEPLAEAEPGEPLAEAEPGEPLAEAEPGEPLAEAEPSEPPRGRTTPPRVSGTYFGMTVWPGLSWAYSPNLEVDQGRLIPGGGGALRVGQAVFPWMTLGLDASGGFYFNRDTFFTEGGLLVEMGFYPVPRYPFSFRGGFGFGAGLILDDRVEPKGGVGGPKFMAGVRYEFFPKADRKRPDRAGGWAVGPELAWRGFTPANRNAPMSNTVLLGLWFGFYWGE